MTDSILRSYYNVSSSTFVPFVFTEPTEGALHLLDGETDGFSIDATSYDDITDEAYVGGPVGGTVAVINTGDPTDDLDNVALDASNLTQSGTSPKMVHFPTSPYVRWSPHNYVVRSQEFDHPIWTKGGGNTISADSTTAPNGTATADLINENTSNANHEVYQGITLPAATPVTISIYAKPGTNSYIQLLLQGPSGNNYITAIWDVTNGTLGETSVGATSGTLVSSSVTSAGSGWYRLALTGSVNIADPVYIVAHVPAASGNSFGSAGDVTFTGTSRTSYVWGAQFVRGYNANPYLVTVGARIGIPQSYDTAASKYGILVEPAVANQVIYSEQFDNAAWNPGGLTVTANDTTAPDGTMTADKVTLTAGTSGRSLYIVIGGLGSSGAYSVYIKPGVTTRYVSLSSQNGMVTYDLQSLVTTQSFGAVTGRVIDVGGGWLRICSEGNLNDTYWIISWSDVATYSYDSFSRNVGAVATGSETFWVWGAQAENGVSIATSYIPTLGSTVTRAADNGISALTTTYPHSATVGTIAVSFKKLIANASQADRIIRLSDGTDNEVIQTYAITTDAPDSFGLGVDDGGAPQVVPTTTKTGSASASTGNAIAFRWKANDFAILADGGTEVTDVSGTLPTVTSLQLGYSEVTAARELQGYIYKMIYVPDDRTQAEMQTLMDRF